MSASEYTVVHNHMTTLETPLLRRRCPGCSFYLVFAFSAAVNALLAVLIIVNMLQPGSFHSNASSGQLDQGVHDVCFACDQVGLEVESLDMYIIRTSSYPLCCQRSNIDVRETFTKVITDEFKRRIAGSGELNSPAMLKVFYETINAGFTGAHLDMVPGKGSKPAWTTHDDYRMSYCASVLSDNGKITVPDKGRYVVYSHVTFNVTRDSRDTMFTHRIHRNGKNAPLLLRKASVTGVSSRRTSFLSAVLKLDKHDVISVNIPDDDCDLVDNDMFSNYVGLFRL
ncbi:tumor necrosis factor ligand superfamily member 6-like [Haliotis asinina]|uniref:tumor necrosis factor ligand superfamily member 6-like n=1 Tax=Haliotis asinina TaxID=109174 RepID=UPI003531D95E